ncbi:carbohydrate ABC transporter permease [Cellulomonas denverensis]|uniref:Sugar ABC transporter permease n=1 Tax=Cellulomonas denverensis TaxID=264297 RepID=A0A7X6R0T9_9CELL|nr:sugar ABC transporter permease [Cellulomonas denverensis]NKY24487.1 sugar ABC transporter permease [Cellulomonas denverensis]GIG25404.1 ABC transporter permease [Cellulomonas denverensis]
MRFRHLRPQGYTWILPAFLLSVGLIYYAVGYTGYMSTLDWNGTSPTSTSVGAANYERAFGDPIFWRAIRNTAIAFVFTFVLQTGLGFLFAAMLHSRPRAGNVYKVVLFLPVVLAPAITAPVFRQIFAPDGQLNQFLRAVGLDGLAQPWLAQTSTALWAVLVIMVWHGTGLAVILYFAAMSQIDPETLEAAEVDGAGNLRKLVSIIGPGVRGTTIALATLTAIGVLKIFDIPYLVTVGGPNFATEFLGIMIYRTSILLGQVGYASAISILMLVLAIVMGVVLNVRRGRDGKGA